MINEGSESVVVLDRGGECGSYRGRVSDKMRDEGVVAQNGTEPGAKS